MEKNYDRVDVDSNNLWRILETRIDGLGAFRMISREVLQAESMPCVVLGSKENEPLFAFIAPRFEF